MAPPLLLSIVYALSCLGKPRSPASLKRHLDPLARGGSRLPARLVLLTESTLVVALAASSAIEPVRPWAGGASAAFLLLASAFHAVLLGQGRPARCHCFGDLGRRARGCGDRGSLRSGRAGDRGGARSVDRRGAIEHAARAASAHDGSRTRVPAPAGAHVVGQRTPARLLTTSATPARARSPRAAAASARPSGTGSSTGRPRPRRRPGSPGPSRRSTTSRC